MDYDLDEKENNLCEIEFDDDVSRASLSTLIDWNNKSDLESYITKQKKIEDKRGFRPS